MRSRSSRTARSRPRASGARGRAARARGGPPRRAADAADDPGEMTTNRRVLLEPGVHAGALSWPTEESQQSDGGLPAGQSRGGADVRAQDLEPSAVLLLVDVALREALGEGRLGAARLPAAPAAGRGRGRIRPAQPRGASVATMAKMSATKPIQNSGIRARSRTAEPRGGRRRRWERAVGCEHDVTPIHAAGPAGPHDPPRPRDARQRIRPAAALGDTPAGAPATAPVRRGARDRRATPASPAGRVRSRTRPRRGAPGRARPAWS